MTKKNIEEFEKVIPDTSVIIEGLLSLKIEKEELKVNEVIIHEAVIAELEHQANQGKAIGYVGIDELKKLVELSEKGKIKIRYAGRRPNISEIKYASLGEIDALIRQLVWEEDALLISADKIQSKIAQARNIKVLFIPKEKGFRKLKLEEFFDETTMSVHLREKVAPMAKKGMPGSWQYVEIRKKLLDADEIKDISREIIEEARARDDGFIEIEREGSTIVQLGHFRIVITRPPFSDGWEITTVRPIKKLNLEEYKMSEKLRTRISEQAEGMLVAGSPGQGKTTFTQAIAEHYAAKGKVVKTVEAPRDMVLPETITQLAISRGSPEEVHDVLLLSRPDYTIFDEMRNTPDFALFSDLRLAGVGMIGVVHATSPIDAIQRFIGRVELGVIPQVVDTVVFIKNGEINKVLGIKMEVKVPSGMTEADLARPIVVVNDFETGKIIAEIYSYGEETVVVPVKEEKASGIKLLAAKSIERSLQRYSEHIHVDVLSDNKAIVYIPEKYIGNIIGKEGKNIAQIEEELGLSIDVREMEELPRQKPTGNEINYQLGETSKHVEFYLGESLVGKDVDIYVNNDYIATFAVGKKGTVRINKDNKLGRTIVDALKHKEKLLLYG